MAAGGEIEPPLKPNHITCQFVELLTNHFEVKVPNNVINQYHVVFAPKIKSSRIRRHLIEQNKDSFRHAYIFDGMSDLKTIEQLPDTLHLTGTRPTDNERINIEITRVGIVAPESKEMERLLNTLIRRLHRHLGMIQIGRHYYERNLVGHNYRGNVEIRRGLKTAIVFHSGELLMRLDTVFMFSRTLSVLNRILQTKRDESDNVPDWREAARKELVNQIVMTTYNNKTYKVEDIDFKMNPKNEFQLDGGEKVKYADYYARRYVDGTGNPIRIQYEDQPLLKCCPLRRNRGDDNERLLYLVPELCVLTGLTDEMQENSSVMEEINRHSKMIPNDRARHLIKSMDKLLSNNNVKQELRTWTVQLSSKLLKIRGKMLRPPAIFVPKTGDRLMVRDADFRDHIGKKTFIRSMDLNNWVIITHRNGGGGAGYLYLQFRRIANSLGVSVSEPQVIATDSELTHAYVRRLGELPPDTTFVVCIVPDNRKRRYDAIKVQCLLSNEVLCQVIKLRNLTLPGSKSLVDRLKLIVLKIFLQIQAKLGAETWELGYSKSLKPFLQPENFMVIGYDTFPDQPPSTNRSAGALIASMNLKCTSYYSSVHFHKNCEEMSLNFTENLENSIRRYQDLNETYPKSIIIYRDGVGEGQYNHVRDFELPRVKNMLQSIGHNIQIKLAFIIVSKRISTRFFQKHNESRSYKNPFPGAVVDELITRPNHSNFYMVSHKFDGGTVTPTAYDIIYDELEMSLFNHQLLAYHLAHLYYNCMEPIRVPAPCQYAHKLARLVGRSLHAIPPESLCDKLFYL